MRFVSFFIDADDLADVVVSSNGNVIVNVDLDLVVSLELECQSKSSPRFTDLFGLALTPVDPPRRPKSPRLVPRG